MSDRCGILAARNCYLVVENWIIWFVGMIAAVAATAARQQTVK
jgi:hypothetical protein